MAKENDEALIALVRELPSHDRSSPERDQLMARVEDRYSVLRGLVETLLVSQPATAAEMVAILWRSWWLGGHVSECIPLLKRAGEIDCAAREEVLEGLGTLAFRSGDLATAEGAFRERLRLVEHSSQPRKVADACADLARIALRRGDFDAVREWAQRGYDAGTEVGPDAQQDPKHMLAAVARMQGRFDDARALYLESRAYCEQAVRPRGVAAEDHNLMYVELHAGNREEAERRFRAASRWIFEHDDAYLRPYAILDAGVLALTAGDLEVGCKLVAAAARIFEETGSIPDPDDSVELDDAVARLKTGLGDTYDELWAAGRLLTLAEAQAMTQA